MLYTYSANIPGPSHIESGIPCQDSCAVENIAGELVIAAVADGLGSETRSDVGSKIAADTSVSYCADHIGDCGSDEDVSAMMRRAYYSAYDAVLAKATSDGESAGQYDSTLCLAIFNGDTLYWGNSGDSGMAVARKDGTYELVTTMQRDDEGRVFPLCFEDHWEFGVMQDVATVLLCTDGILEDMIAPPILKAHSDNPIDTSKAVMFLHPQEGDVENLNDIEEQARAYLEGYPKRLLDDDKTLVVIFDGDNFPGRQSDPYYDGPDWKAIVEKANRALYENPAVRPRPSDWEADGLPPVENGCGAGVCEDDRHQDDEAIEASNTGSGFTSATRTVRNQEESLRTAMMPILEDAVDAIKVTKPHVEKAAAAALAGGELLFDAGVRGGQILREAASERLGESVRKWRSPCSFNNRTPETFGADCEGSETGPFASE